MSSPDRIFRPELPLVVGDGQSVPVLPVNTGKTEQSVFRNGQWVEFWSRPNGGAHTPVADFSWAQSGPSQTTTAQPTGITTVDGPQTVDVTTTAFTVSFNGLASFEINGRIVAWDWDFGDGGAGSTTTTAATLVDSHDGTGTLTGLTDSGDGTGASSMVDFGDGTAALSAATAATAGATVNHVYVGAQTYMVTLTVTDQLGAKATVTKSVTVTGTAISQPRANIVPSVNGYTVNYDGQQSSSTNGATIVRWEWTFGDGGTGLGSTVSHTYVGGTYTATLKVTDSNGYTGTSSVQVTTANTAPVPSFTATLNNLTVAVDASGSKDPDGSIASYAWDFGDGLQGVGQTATHTYASTGTYPVRLTVTDNLNTETSLTKSVTVTAANASPTAAFTTSANALVLSVDGSASSDPNGPIASYAWTFGDGATGTGVTASHTYASGGTRTVTLTVTDGQGATGSTSQSVTTVAANVPPVPSFTVSANALTINLDASASTDPDGFITAHNWDFGDGGTASAITPSHTYANAGTYTVRLTTFDNQGVSASTTKVVTVSKPATDYIVGAAVSSSTLKPASNLAVLQQFIRSPDTGDFYSSQVHPEANGFESVRLSRMATSGALLDQMVLTTAGHGTTFGLEYTGGQMFIWLTWQRANDNTTIVNDIVRFPYQAGTFTRSQVAPTVKIPGPTYRLIAFDYRGGYAVIRTGGTYTRHRLADVFAGNISAPLNTINLPDAPPTLQGFATYYDSLFRYTGVSSDNATRATDSPTIAEYSWTTGQAVRTIDTSAFGGTTSRTEPEGMSIYNTGVNPVLFFGVTTGPVGGPHGYPTWWYPLYNPDTVTTPTPPPSGNTAKSPWQSGSPTEGLPAGVNVVKWSSIATSSSDNNNPMVAINRLTGPSVIDISNEQLTLPNFALLNSSTNYFPTALGHRFLFGFIGGISNGSFNNKIQVAANAMSQAQLDYTAAQTKGADARVCVWRAASAFGGAIAPSYFMGVHLVGADQGRITEQAGAQFSPVPGRHMGLMFSGQDNASVLQNCLLQGINSASGNTPPWEIGAVNFLHSKGSLIRRVEVDGQLPIGSPSRPSSSTVDPYGRNWKRSGGFQFSADNSSKCIDLSVHSGLVSGLSYSVAGTSNNTSARNSVNVWTQNLYVEDQSMAGFSGTNMEDTLGSVFFDHPIIKMNGTGGNHLKMNPYLQSVQAPNITNFQVIEPTWSGLGYNGMFSIGIAKWGTMQTTAPSVIKNGIQLTATTSTTADPARFYHIQAL